MPPDPGVSNEKIRLDLLAFNAIRARAYCSPSVIYEVRGSIRIHFANLFIQLLSHESIKSLSSISSYTSPREKLDAVIDFFSNMKSSIVDYWKGKVELTTMDDILPLVIYTVCYCNCENFASEINFLKDFVKFAGNETTESAERTLTNIEMGIQYVNTTDEFPFSEM